MTVFSELKYWFYGDRLAISTGAIGAKHRGAMMAYMHCMKWTANGQLADGAPSCRMSTADLAAKCPISSWDGTCPNQVHSCHFSKKLPSGSTSISLNMTPHVVT